MKLLILLALFAFSGSAFAKGDIKAGQAKAATCVACHGQKGISSNPMWPNLAGQKDVYLLNQLKAFKSGKRKNPTMDPFIKNLTVKDMENLAAYFASLSCK